VKSILQTNTHLKQPVNESCVLTTETLPVQRNILVTVRDTERIFFTESIYLFNLYRFCVKRRSLIATGCVCVNTAISGCLSLDRIKYRDEPWVTASLIADNIRAGFDSKQLLEISLQPSNVMGNKLPDENQKHHLRIDVSSLEQYGVDIENLSVETTKGKWGGPGYNNNIDTLDFTNGVIDIVVLTSEDVNEANTVALNLTGFQFTDVEAATKIQYDVQSPDDHVEISNESLGSFKKASKCGFMINGAEFTLINPKLLPPTLCPASLGINRNGQGSQNLIIEWLTPKEDEMYVDIDISSLDGYATVEGASIKLRDKSANSDESRIWGATLEDATIEDWTVSLKLVPDSGSSYASASVRISGMEMAIEESVEGLSYDMSIEGDAQETVETESFNITGPSPEGGDA